MEDPPPQEVGEEAEPLLSVAKAGEPNLLKTKGGARTIRTSRAKTMNETKKQLAPQEATTRATISGHKAINREAAEALPGAEVGENSGEVEEMEKEEEEEEEEEENSSVTASQVQPIRPKARPAALSHSTHSPTEKGAEKKPTGGMVSRLVGQYR